MKNIIIIVLIAFGVWYFYDLGQDSKSVENAKKEMGVIKKDNSDIKEDKKIIVKSFVKPTYEVIKLDNKNFIEIDNLDSKIEKLTEEIKITGKIINENVDKIVVNFRNTGSDFPNDRYELQTFKKGNKIFEYNATSKVFRNIDYGNNEYLIESYIGSNISKIQLNINIPENLGESLDKEKSDETLLIEKVTYDKKIIGEGDDSLYLGMPISESFGKPLSLGNGEITYSNISGLSIKKDIFSASELSSDNIWKSDSTGYLNKNIESSYIYWNTFREIDYSNKNSGISFYVLRKSGNKYIYEKYYFDFKNSLKGILKIKKFDVGEESVSIEMSELNDGLKKQNEDFEIVKITDKLFKEIVR